MPADIVPLGLQRWNHLWKVSVGGKDFVIKVYGTKPWSWKIPKYRLLGAFGAYVPVEFRSASERCAFERSATARWIAGGYKVPHIYDDIAHGIAIPDGAPHMVRDYVPGETLADLLRDPSVPLTHKLATLDLVIRHNRERHDRSLSDRDHLLVHFDSQLANIIVAGNDAIHIDFETGRENEPLIKSVTREVVTLAIQAVNALGREGLDEVARIVAREYGKAGIAGMIVRDGLASRQRSRTLVDGTLLQINRYDLATALARLT